MNSLAIQQKVVEFLVQTTGEVSLGPETELQESGILDSLLMMDLLLYIETEFGVRLEFADLTPAVFHSASTIALLVSERLIPISNRSGA